MDTQTQDLLTTTQAAEILGVCPDRVRVFCVQGRIKATKIVGAWLMKREDVEALVRAPTGRPSRTNPTETQRVVTAAIEQGRNPRP
jgi:excisionase family DNA binding protein